MASEQGTPPEDTKPTGVGSRRRRGVTIDLEAETTGTSDPAAASEPVTESDPVAVSETVAKAGDGVPEKETDSRAAAKIGAGVPALLLAGFAGGIVALAFAYGLQFAGVLPFPGKTEADQARADIAGLNDTLSALDQRVTGIEAGNAQSIADRALLDDLSKQVGVVDAFGTSLSDRLLAAEASIAALEEGDNNSGGADKQQLDDLSKRVARLETAPPAGDDPSPQLAQLAARVAALESAAASREAADPSQPAAGEAPGKSDPAASAAAIDTLRQAAAESRPFAAELAQLDDGVIAPATRAALLPLAEKGVPTRAALIAEFPTVAAAIVADEPVADGDGGFLGIVTAYGRSLVTVRPTGSQAGDEPEAVVARMRTAVAAGDLATALAARDGLPAQGQAASDAWAAAVADRLEIERLLGDIPAPAESAGGSG